MNVFKVVLPIFLLFFLVTGCSSVNWKNSLEEALIDHLQQTTNPEKVHILRTSLVQGQKWGIAVFDDYTKNRMTLFTYDQKGKKYYVPYTGTIDLYPDQPLTLGGTATFRVGIAHNPEITEVQCLYEDGKAVIDTVVKGAFILAREDNTHLQCQSLHAFNSVKSEIFHIQFEK